MKCGAFQDAEGSASTSSGAAVLWGDERTVPAAQQVLLHSVAAPDRLVSEATASHVRSNGRYFEFSSIVCF